jgi:hypothetical protein
MNSVIATARAQLASLLDVKHEEQASLGLSFVTFFCVLASYFTVRPLRETMGVSLGKDALEYLFVGSGATVWIYRDQAAAPQGSACDLRIFHRQPNRVRGGDATGDRAMAGGHVFRLGERLQPVCRVTVLVADVGPLVERPRQALVWHYRGGRNDGRLGNSSA